MVNNTSYIFWELVKLIVRNCHKIRHLNEHFDTNFLSVSCVWMFLFGLYSHVLSCFYFYNDLMCISESVKNGENKISIIFYLGVLVFYSPQNHKFWYCKNQYMFCKMSKILKQIGRYYVLWLTILNFTSYLYRNKLETVILHQLLIWYFQGNNKLISVQYRVTNNEGTKFTGRT